MRWKVYPSPNTLVQIPHDKGRLHHLIQVCDWDFYNGYIFFFFESIQVDYRNICSFPISGIRYI